MALAWVSKDPAEVREYSIEWTGSFTYDYITASTWAITAGGAVLVINSNNFTDNKTAVVLSAGTTATTYTLVNTVTTSKGRTLKKSATITVTSL